MGTRDIYQGYEDDLIKEERLSAIIYACIFLIIMLCAFVLILLNYLFFEIDRLIDSKVVSFDLIDFSLLQSLLTHLS